MKKINTSFSLFDFNKKRADKVQLFGRESLDEDGNLIPFIEQSCISYSLFAIERLECEYAICKQSTRYTGIMV